MAFKLRTASFKPRVRGESCCRSPPRHGRWNSPAAPGRRRAPYQIATARQLVSLGADPNLLGKYFALVGDIDLDPNLPGGQVFTHAVIAYDEDPYSGRPVAYTGRFYGNGHTIRHLTIDGAGMQYLGLFGRVGPTGRVYDLALEDACIRATDHAAPLVGFNEGGLTNCSVTGRICGAAAQQLARRSGGDQRRHPDRLPGRRHPDRG